MTTGTYDVSFDVHDLSERLSAERLQPRISSYGQSGGRPGQSPPNNPRSAANLRSSGPASLREPSKAPSNRCEVINGVMSPSPSQASFSPARTAFRVATQQHRRQTVRPAPVTSACLRYTVRRRLTAGGSPSPSAGAGSGGASPASPSSASFGGRFQLGAQAPPPVQLPGTRQGRVPSSPGSGLKDLDPMGGEPPGHTSRDLCSIHSTFSNLQSTA